MTFELNQIFTTEYPPEAADFCNQSGTYYIDEIEPDENGNRRFQIKAIPAPTFEELKERKLADLSASFNDRVSGAFTTSQGYLMQFDRKDSELMQGAITLYEAAGVESGYITQANDETIYDVPIATMKAVLLEMLAAYAACHKRKQELRTLINAAHIEESLNAIEITWPL